MGFRLRDLGEGHDLDEVIWVGYPTLLDDRPGRRSAAEKLLPQIGVFGELVGIGDVGAGLDDVGELRASRLQTGFDFLPDLLQLRPDVALADDFSAVAARALGADDNHVTTITQRDFSRRWRGGARRSEY